MLLLRSYREDRLKEPWLVTQLDSTSPKSLLQLGCLYGIAPRPFSISALFVKSKDSNIVCVCDPK